MQISRFRIHNILKTCQKNIRWYRKKEWSDGGRSRAQISIEGRRAQICQKAANDVLERLTTAGHRTASNPEESQ